MIFKNKKKNQSLSSKHFMRLRIKEDAIILLCNFPV